MTPWWRRLRLPSWVTGGRWIARIGLPDGGKAPTAAPGGRLALILLLTALAAIWGAETLSKASLPLLVRNHPLLLIALDARAHDLLLASPKVGTAEFIMVGLASRFTVHWLYYLLGRWYGDAALRWVARRSRIGSRAADRSERAFRRYAFPAVFLLSNKPVCVLAGTSGMAPVVFVALHLPGTMLRIVVLRVIARSGQSTFRRPGAPVSASVQDAVRIGGGGGLGMCVRPAPGGPGGVCGDDRVRTWRPRRRGARPRCSSGRRCSRRRWCRRGCRCRRRRCASRC